MGLGSFISNLLNVAASAMEKAVDISVDYTVTKVKETYEAASILASDTKHFVTTTCPKTLGKLVPDVIYHNDIDEDWDGKYISNCRHCNSKIKNIACLAETGSKTEPETGKKPILGHGKECAKSPLPKITFINGIDNTPQENCAATKAIASATCSEVIGVYNRTQGLVTDLLECIGNIFNHHPFGGDVPTSSMKKIIVDSINNKSSVTLFAHSQGGLVTREALIEAKKELRKSGMSNGAIERKMRQFINVKSFGTAEQNWPKGPKYEQYSHVNDPVPKVIYAGDATHSIVKITPIASITKDQKHILKTQGKDGKILTGFDAHNMVNSYSPVLAEQRKMDSNETKCSACPHRN